LSSAKSELKDRATFFVWGFPALDVAESSLEFFRFGGKSLKGDQQIIEERRQRKEKEKLKDQGRLLQLVSVGVYPVDKISPIPSSTSLLPGAVRHSVRVLSRQTEQKSSTPLIPRNYPTPRARHQWNVNVRSVSEDEAGSPSDMAVQSRTLGKTVDTTHLPSSEQRHFLLVFSVLAIIRLHFALSNSYIHPDEHFQGPEVVVGLDPV
jgi:hypothetical protein